MTKRKPFVHDYVRYFKAYEQSTLRSFNYNNDKWESACLNSQSIFGNTFKIFVSLRDYITLKTEIDDGTCFPILYFEISKEIKDGQIFKHINHYIFNKKCHTTNLYLEPEPDCMTLLNIENNKLFKIDPYYLERVYEDYDFDDIANSFLMKNSADGTYMRLEQK